MTVVSQQEVSETRDNRRQPLVRDSKVPDDNQSSALISNINCVEPPLQGRG